MGKAKRKLSFDDSQADSSGSGSSRRTTRSSPYESGQFAKSCKCVAHDIIKSSEKTLLRYRQSHDHIAEHWDWLVENKYVGHRAQIVCQDCLDFAAKKVPKNSSSTCTSQRSNENAGDKKLTPEVERFLHVVEEGISDFDMEKLMYTLGEKLSLSVFHDSKELMQNYKDMKHTCETKQVNYINERPKSLISFLQGVTNQDIATCDESKVNAFCILLEQLYFVRNKNFIGPYSFSQHLVKWGVTGSKLASSVDGSTTASGSVTSLQKVIKDSSTVANTTPDGDVDAFFDNTQRTGKTTRVRESGTTPVNVATNVVFIQNSPPTNLQKRADLKPVNWLGKMTVEQAKQKIEDRERELNATFREYRGVFQAKMLDQVLSEIKELDEEDIRAGDVNDHVWKSETVKERYEGHVVCPRCEHVYMLSQSLCPLCSYNPKTLPDKSSEYGDVPDRLPSQPAVVKIGEVIGVNPNSKNTITEVIEKIQQQCKVSGDDNEREWVRIGSDGLPYRIAHGIIQNTVQCSKCGKIIDLRDLTFEKHVEESHAGDVGVGSKRYYDSVFLVPGAGHTEINILRAIFSMCRKIFLEEIADALGFISKGAKDFIVKGGNHHVTWQIFKIVLTAFALELLLQYVVECHRQSETPSVSHFWYTWMNSVKNTNYLLFSDLVFDWFLGVKCFRSGIRRGNSEYALAGRQKVSPLMYTGKHPIYKQLLYSDMKLRVEAPPDMQSYIRNNEAFSRSGDRYSAEGGDYIVENENRVLKSHLPPGVPTLQAWVNASRCHEILQENRKLVFERAGIKDPGQSSSSIFNFELEVQMVRRMIRTSGLLKDPLQTKPLTSLDGVALHPELVNVCDIARKNYALYLEDPERDDLSPVFVTLADELEYNNVCNWTISKIDSEAMLELDSLADMDTVHLLRELHRKEIRRAPKAKHVEFYQMVMNAKAEEITQNNILETQD